MDFLLLLGHGALGHLIAAVWQSIAFVLFVFLLSFIPCYVALYHGRIMRAFGLSWVVLIADIGMFGMPPVGFLIWLGALAYAARAPRGPAVVYVQEVRVAQAGPPVPAPRGPVRILGWTLHPPQPAQPRIGSGINHPR